jgi:hypothetical protein
MDNEYDIVNLLLNRVYMFDLSSENIKPIWLIFFKLSFKLVAYRCPWTRRSHLKVHFSAQFHIFCLDTYLSKYYEQKTRQQSQITEEKKKVNL